ncbi:MAG: radical SAM protein [Victivallaceae bacterium]
MKRQYIFGPVASRRLGVSLGIDLVQHKTCSLNCVYCEAGATTALTIERKEYVPTAEVIRQLDEFLKKAPVLDYITFSGAGEPTLHSGIGQVVDFVKTNYPQYKLCLLTNATLFDDEKLLAEIANVDLVVPSLDASNEEEFEKINRPAEELDFEAFIRMLVAYCRTTTAEVWLEIFIVPGVNDSDESIKRFVEIVNAVKPAKVQLNTLDRPGCVDWIKASTSENTLRFIKALEPVVPVEAVGPFKYKSVALREPISLDDIDRLVMELVSRRPCTLEDVQLALGRDADAAKQHLSALLSAGKIQSERRERGEFFSVAVLPN